jgi:hypothetical protein
MASDGAAERSSQLGGHRPSGAKRQVGLPEVIAHHLAALPGGAAETAARPGRLLPTPDTGVSPHGHGRRGGRPGNGHQSGNGLDATARTLPAGTASGQAGWGEYEPAIRRWERILGHPAPPPAEPGPGGRTRLSAAFTEWMMGLPAGWVTGLPGIPRTYALRILGNGVVPRQGACALRLLIAVTACPAPPATASGHAPRHHVNPPRAPASGPHPPPDSPSATPAPPGGRSAAAARMSAQQGERPEPSTRERNTSERAPHHRRS